MSEHVPSVSMVRARYCDSIVRGDDVAHSLEVTPEEHAKNHAEFDRWLAEVERVAAEKAWDELAGYVATKAGGQSEGEFLKEQNPYRKAVRDD